MKHLLYKITTLILFVFVALQLNAQRNVDRSTVIHSNKISPDADIEITNEFGHILFETWNKDSFKVVVYITIDEEDEELVKQIKERITIPFHGSEDYISVKTQIEQKSIKKWKEAFKPDVLSKKNVKILYLVSVPRTVNIEVTNKFGDVSLDEVDGDIKVNLERGLLRVQKSTKNIKATVKFGDIKIKEMHNGDFEIDNTNLEIELATKVEVNSSGSEIEIQKVEEFELTSKRDDVEIDEVAELKANSSFTDYEIERVKNKLDLDISFGNCDVDALDCGFEKVYINQKNATTEIDGNDCVYNFNGYFDDTEVFIEEDSNVNLESTPSKTEKNVVSTVGTVGSASNSTIKVITKGGRFSITK